jgi:predicted RNase H-related nuclease YkuK (DUF458 family)
LEPSSLEVSVSEGIKIDALNSLAVGRILKCPKIKTTKKASEEPEIYALYFRYYGASAGTLVSSGVNGTSAQIREWLENFERTTNAEYNVWMESMNNGDNDEEYPKNFNEEQRSLIDYYHDYGVIAVPVEGGQVLEGQFQGGRGWDADTQQIVENSSVDWKLNPIDDEYVSTSDGIKLEGMNIFVGRKTKMPTFIRKKASDPREGVENCQECGEHLNGDDVLEVNKKVVCPDCADKFHRKEAILEEAPVFIGGRLMDDHDYLFRGLPITVEKWKGERRHNRILQADYGFIPDTTGRGDGEAVDVYVGDDHHSPHAYVLEQLKEDGSFDEYKVLLGFESLPEAEAVYLAQFDPGWRETRVQAIHEVPVEEFLDVAEDNMDEDPKTAASHREWWPYGRHKFVPQEGSPECKACELPADHLLHTTPPPEKQASFQIEAEANYDEMFAGLNSTIQNALPPVDGKSGVAISLHQDIQDEINWAKATLRKNYRIIWYLRWAKLDLIEQGVNKTYTYFGREKDIDPATLNEKAHNLGQQLNSLLNKEIGRFNAGAQKAGRHAINTTDLGGVMRAYGVHNQLKHFFDMKQVDKIQDYPLDFQTIPEVLDTFQTFEQEYTAQADEDKRWVPPTSDEEGDLQGEVIVKFPNGWVWWDLGTNYDENEAKSMGHCATCGENATLVSLREPRDNKDGTRSWRPHLTFELDEDGSLRQMKGVANSKPKPEYHSYILALLTATKQVSSKSKKTEPIVKSIKGSSYKREADFALKDLTPEDLETLYAARPDLMPIDIYVQKHGVTRDLMVRVEGELKGVGYKSKWNGSKKSPLFEIEAWENLEDLIGDKGNDLAQWAWKITTNGEEFLDSSNYFNIDTTAKELWDNLPDEMKENVKQILDHKYPQEFKKFLADAQAEAATRRGRIPRENVIDFAEERDEEDLLQAIRNAAQVGEETGTQNEIFKSLKKALEDSAFVPKDPDNYYDGPWVENLALSEAADLINDTGQNSRMDGGDGDLDHRIVMKEPNYGFADFDEKAAVEYFSNEYGIEKKLKDIEPAKVASTKIIEDYETPRLKVQVTGSPQRLFFEGTLKPEAHDWLTKVNFTDKVVVNFTVDLGADGEAYLNRLDSDIRYRGFGPELMKSALGKIAEMGYKHAKTYIENDNYASQAMVKKLGGTEVPDSYNGQGSYYEFNMGGSHKEAVAVSETGQRYMALSGDKIVEEATIGEYELMVVKSGMIPNIYQVGLQRIGMDAFDPMQQLTKTPNSRGKGSLAEVKRVLNHWLQKYGELVIASHNPDKTPLYVAMVKRLGFKVDNLNLMGWRIPCISKTAAEESEKYSLFTASFETVRKKEELNSSTMLRPIGKIGTL